MYNADNMSHLSNDETISQSNIVAQATKMLKKVMTEKKWRDGPRKRPNKSKSYTVL